MKYNFLDYLRSRRFLILLAIVLLISAVLTIVVGYYRPGSFLASELSFYSSWWGTSAVFLVALFGIFFGGDAISGEFQNRTDYFSLPHPIRRSSVYAGKWLAALLASSIVLVVFTAITLGNGAYYFGMSAPSQFGESVLLAWFYLVAVLGFTFFFSSLFKSTSYSILVTAVLFLRSEEHTSELQSPDHLVCRLLLEKKEQQEVPNRQAILRHRQNVGKLTMSLYPFAR